MAAATRCKHQNLRDDKGEMMLNNLTSKPTMWPSAEDAALESSQLPCITCQKVSA